MHVLRTAQCAVRNTCITIVNSKKNVGNRNQLRMHQHVAPLAKWRWETFCHQFVCLLVSYLFREGHSTDMCSLLQENLGGKKESVSRSYVHVCWKKVMKMKRFNVEVYTGSPKVNLSCFREFEELERCLRYSVPVKLRMLKKERS